MDESEGKKTDRREYREPRCSPLGFKWFSANGNRQQLSSLLKSLLKSSAINLCLFSNVVDLKGVVQPSSCPGVRRQSTDG